jgi:plasmid replication initiation protein
MTDKNTELHDMIQNSKFLIIKDNRFVQQAYFHLNHTQTMALSYLISKIQPNHKPDHRFTFDCEEFCTMLRWTTPRYNTVREAVRQLTTQDWWLRTDNGIIHHVGFLTNVQNLRQQRYMEVQFSDACAEFLFGIRTRSDTYKRYLLDLQDQREEGILITYETPDPAYYTACMMETISFLKHRYAPRLYEILKSHANKSTWTFEVGTGSALDLQPMLSTLSRDEAGNFNIPTAWSNWSCFYRDALEDAIRDINQFTDLTVSCSGYYRDFSYRKTRGIRTVVFTIEWKSEKEMGEVNQRIAAGYRAYQNSRIRKDAARAEARSVKRQIKKIALQESNGIWDGSSWTDKAYFSELYPDDGEEDLDLPF